MLFNILQSQVHDSRVLDLFAGSGSLGLESVARGASQATFIEKNRKVASVLKKNIDICCFQDRTELHIGELPGSLNKLAGYRPYDLVLADPPYDLDVNNDLLEKLLELSLVNEDTLIVLETSSRAELSLSDTWDLDRKKILGDTAFHFIYLK